MRATTSASLVFSLLLSFAPEVFGFTTQFRTIRRSLDDVSRSPSSHMRSRMGGVGLATTLADDDDSATLQDYQDLLYIANITVAGTQYSVQLDTGSSDLVIFGTPSSATDSGIALNLTYGTGFAAGSISTGAVSFSGQDVPKQAFLASSSYNNPTQHYADGIFGLGFTTLSNIAVTVLNSNASWGGTFLSNVFAQTPSEPNFMAFSLSRAPNGTTDDVGGFSIGELDEEWSAVSTTDHLSTWPVSNPSRWNIVIDGYETLAGNGTFSSVVPKVASGKAVLLLDSGTSYAYAPEPLVTAMYQNVKGATFDSSAGQWNVPCDQQVFLGFWIGSRRFDVHPLDLVVTNINDPSSCVGSFVSQTLAVGAGEYDILAGDVFMRNVYTLFDFGDYTDSSNLTMGDPYVQLISTTNITNATREFQQIRGGTTTLNVTNPTNAGSGGSTSPLPSTGVSLADLQSKINHLENMQPIFFAVLGANAVVMLVAVGFGVWFACCRRRKSGAGAGNRKNSQRSGRRGRAGAPADNTVSTMELTPKDDSGAYTAVSTDNPDGEPLAPPGGLVGARQSTVSFRMDPYRQSRTLSGVSAFRPMVPMPAGAAITAGNDPSTPTSERGFDLNLPSPTTPERARVSSMPAPSGDATRRLSAMPPPGAMMAPGMTERYRASSYGAPQATSSSENEHADRRSSPLSSPMHEQQNFDLNVQAGAPPSPSHDPQQATNASLMPDVFARAPPPQRHSALPGMPFPSSSGGQSAPSSNAPNRYSAMPAGARGAPNPSGFAPLTRQISPLASSQPAAAGQFEAYGDPETDDIANRQHQYDYDAEPNAQYVDAAHPHAYHPDSPSAIALPSSPIPQINVSSEDLTGGQGGGFSMQPPQFPSSGTSYRHSARAPPRAPALNNDADNAYRRSAAM